MTHPRFHEVPSECTRPLVDEDSASKHPWLVELSGANDSQQLTLSHGDSRVLGTAAASDIQVDDRTVSSRHGRLSVHEGRLFYEDLGSRNGSHAGGVRIERAEMTVGSCVVLGTTILACVGRATLDEPPGDDEPPLADMIGQSLAMRRLAREVRQLAPLRAPVLVHGESGAGKELVASALHRNSARATRPLVALNMGALPGDLADAELFGHERGAFTGADRERKGAFEQARGGTLFLDEIAELCPGSQALLLRALENGEIRPVGATGTRKIDARVVAATWASLDELVERGVFRADLFHRLAVFTITVPPLRVRPTDIAPLSEYFLRRFSDEVGPHELSSSALSRLLAHPWPGNVRELRNVLMRACVMAPEPRISSGDIQRALDGTRASSGRGSLTPTPPRATMVREVLEAHGGNVSAASRALGIARSTVRSRAKGK